MGSWTGVIIMGLVMNISSIVPALFFKSREKSKNINFDTNLFAICFLDTDTYYIDDQYYWRIFNISCLATNSISCIFHDFVNGIY